MQTQPLRHPSPNPISFGIYKGSKITAYGEYTWGVFKGYRIEIYNAKEHNQKLQYVSDSRTLKWLKSKLIYIQDGIRKVLRSE